MKYRKGSGRAAARNGKSPRVPFSMVSRLTTEGFFSLSLFLYLFLSLVSFSFSLSLTRLSTAHFFFPPKSNQWHRVNYGAASEDNWILIRFLSRCFVVVPPPSPSLCCAFLFLSIRPSICPFAVCPFTTLVRYKPVTSTRARSR